MRAAVASVDGAAEPVRAGLLAARLGSYLVWSGDEALDAYQQALDLVPAEPPTAARARILAGQAQALIMASRQSAAQPRAEEALAVARLAGARPEQGWALLALGCALTGQGEWDAGLAHLGQALEVAEELGDLELLGEVVLFLPWALVLQPEIVT
jgi:tetratricopeptide (TPR) repeat protein